MTESTIQNLSFDQDVMLFNAGVNIYAIDLKRVKEIILPPSHLAQLPLTPPLIRGLLLSRDDIYPLVHLEGHSIDLTKDEARIILVTDGERRVALYADHLHDILSLSTLEKLNDEATTHPEWVPCAFDTQRGKVHLVDFDHLYASLVEQAEKADSISIS